MQSVKSYLQEVFMRTSQISLHSLWIVLPKSLFESDILIWCSQSEGKTQQEAMYINKSLTFLEQTIIALADKKREHVPYRQTKLTHALKDSLGKK